MLAHADATSQYQDPMAARLVGLLAAEISGPMTDALARVSQLARDGRIDRAGLEALAKDIALARRFAMTGQRISRLVAGVAQQPAEAVALPELLEQVGTRAPSLAPLPLLHDVTRPCPRVAGDPALLHALVESAATWAAERARTPLRWSLRMESWPPRALLACSFEPEDGVPSSDGDDPSLDGLLMRYAAHACNAAVRIHSDGDTTRLELRFANIVNDSLEGLSAVELATPIGPGAPLAGCQVLVLAHQRGVRQNVRQALRRQDVFVDYAHSVDAALAYCDDGLPQVLIYESDFHGDALAGLTRRLLAVEPAVALVELAPGRTPVQRHAQGLCLGEQWLDGHLETELWLHMQHLAVAPANPKTADPGPACPESAGP